MADCRYIGVIDIGKTNAKYAIVDSRNWIEVAVRTMPNRVLAGPPYPHFDVKGMWTFLLASMRELNAEYPVDAISITTHGASGALVDSEGELAMPVLDYEHDGPDSMATDYDRVRPPFSETGSPRLPMGLNLGAQFHWQMKAFPDAARRVAHILTYPQYWALRLTGVMANEVTSLGCHTDLWSPWTGEFSSLVEREGWTGRMAPVRRAGDVLGPLLPEIAAETGLAKETPVLCGIHDSNASLYPHLAQRIAPFAVVSSGTWVICMAIGGKNIAPDPARDTLVNVNAFGDPVPSARFMGGREFEVLMGGYQESCGEDDMEAILASGTMLLPSVETRSGPFQGRRTEWHGEEPGGGKRYAAVSLYLALMTSVCLDLCGADGPSIVEGPFAKNEAYLAMLEVATGRPVIASGTSATGTSIGAAMLASQEKTYPVSGGIAHETGPGTDRHDELAGYAQRWKSLVSGQD